MMFKYLVSTDLPPLGWVLQMDQGCDTVVANCGSAVEAQPTFFVEGAWDDEDFAAAGFTSSQVFLGSGARLAGDALVMITLVMPLRVIANFIQVVNQGIGRRFHPDECHLGPVGRAGSVLHWCVFLGGLGLSLSWLLVSPILFLQIAFRGGAGLPMDRFAIMRSLGRSLIPAIGMLLAIHGVRFLSGEALNAAIRLPLLILAGAITYIALSRMPNRDGFNEVLGFLRGLHGSKARSA